MSIKVFVRQPFTETTPREAGIVQTALDGVSAFADASEHNFEFLTGNIAHDRDTFREAFTSKTGGVFTARRFRDNRLGLLSRADVMLIVRTGLSESGAFEVAYNIFGGRHVPMLFAIWVEAEIKTTLLRDLDDIAKVRYIRFTDPATVASEFSRFVEQIVIPDIAERERKQLQSV